MNLTIHIILRSQTDLLSSTLESILPLNSRILIGDLGTNKNALDICKSYKAEIKKYSWNKNMSEVRNLMIGDSKTDWNMYIEPWEVLMTGHDDLLAIQEKSKAYKMPIMTEDSIRKEIRLWHKNTKAIFENPIFETLNISNCAYFPGIIWENKVQKLDVDEILLDWEKKFPFSQDMKYFKALGVLSSGRYQEFANIAKQYLLQQKTQPIAVSMIRYYLGIVHCIIDSNLEEATKNVVLCLAANPLMAEFWCLLGDISFKSKDFIRAKCFYENAKILGGRRLSEDPWPMNISKYDEYPTKMLDIIKNNQVH